MTRIWNDGALRRIPLWLAITMMTTNVFLGVIIWRQATVGPSAQPLTQQLLCILWLAVAIYLLAGDVRRRCQALDLALPIPARDLWWSHLGAVIIAGGVILAGSLIVVAGHQRMIGRLDTGRGIEASLLDLGAPLLAGVLLAAALIGSLEPALWKLHGQPSYWIFLISSLGGILVILLLLAEKPWIAVGMLSVMAVLVITSTLRKLPPAFRVVPSDPVPARRRRAVDASTAMAVGPSRTARILFAVIHNAPPWKQFTPWMLYFFVALLGFIVAGGFERWSSELDDMRFMYLPMGSYMLLAGYGLLTYHLYRLDPLPVPRRLLFALVVLPGIVIFVAGYLAGQLTIITDPQPVPAVTYRVEARSVTPARDADAVAAPRGTEPMTWVEIDRSFMRASLTGDVPELSSSWGESHLAWSRDLTPALPLVVYNPYNTIEETTADFEALMTSRAIGDIHGVTISADEIRDRYFVVDDSRVVALADGGFTLAQDYALPEAPSAGPEFPVYMTLVLVPALLLTALFTRSFRAEHSNSYIRTVYWIGLGLLLAILIIQAVLTVFGLFHPDVGRDLLAILIHSLGTSPLTSALTWLGATGIVYAAYRIARRQFERAEIPAAPINCSMIDFGRSDQLA